MKKIFTLAVVLNFCLAGFTQSSKAEEDNVWKSVETLTNYIFGVRDSAKLDAMVVADVSYAHSSGVVQNKKEMMQEAVNSPTTYKNIEIERGTISIYNNTAVLRHNLRGVSVAPNGGAESPLNLGILQVWRKENGQWKIWARQAVRIAPKS